MESQSAAQAGASENAAAKTIRKTSNEENAEMTTTIDNENFVLLCDDEEPAESCCSPRQQLPERPFQRSALSIKNETDPIGRARRVGFLFIF